MNSKEKLLCSKLLNLASEDFDNHGCNDLDDEFFEDWTEEEKKELNEKVGKTLEFESGEGEDEDFLSDNTLMFYFAGVLEKEGYEEE